MTSEGPGSESILPELAEMRVPNQASVQKSMEWLVVVGMPHRNEHVYRGNAGIARLVEYLCNAWYSKTLAIHPIDYSRMRGDILWRSALDHRDGCVTPQERAVTLIERARFLGIRNRLAEVTLSGHRVPVMAHIEVDKAIGYTE
jgi:hypothetical protein